MRYNRREFAVKAVERERGQAVAKQTSGQASQSQKTSESQKTAKKTTKKTEHVLEQTPKSLLIGTGMTLLGGAMWGMNSTVAKLLMRDYQLDPIWLSCVRALFASLIFLVGSAITTPQKLTGAVKDVRSYPKYLVTTLICVLLVQVSYLMTIDWTNSGTATVLQTLNLIFVLAWVCLRGKRLPLKRELVGVLLAFAGTFLIATGGNFASLSLPWQGLAWGLVDAVSTAAMSILPVVLMLKWGNMTINGITFLMSGLILCPFAQPWSNIPALDARGVLLLLYTIVCGTFLAFWLYMAGVMRVGAVRATMLGTSEPVMATITAVAWAGETFTFTDLTGFAMIIIMVFLVR